MKNSQYNGAVMIYLQTKPTANGWTYQIAIDTENKTIKRGAFIFNSAFTSCTKGLTKTQYNDIINGFINNGFTEV